MLGDGRGRDAGALAGARDETERVEEARTLQSDADQLASHADQRHANRDQQASDRDQVASDWEHAHVPAAALTDQAYQTSRTERQAAGRERDSTAAARSTTTAQRLATAARRDEVSRVRDLSAAARDRTADARDLAADAREAAADARDRAADACESALGRSGPLMAEIEQWDGHALGKLMQRGSMTVGEIVESVQSDQLGLLIARAWVANGLERGLIAKTGGSNESTRYSIVAAGRNAAAVRTGRFVVSEKARDGEPSRRF
jgi:hypothetical protein